PTTPSADHCTDLCRITPDRRRYKRVELNLLGRFMRASKNEFPCRLIDISVGGAALSSPVTVEDNEQIVAYFDHLGGLEGQVVRTMADGFAIEFNATVHRRQKLAAQLTGLINEELIEVADLRRKGHDRIKLDRKKLIVEYDDGRTEECTAIDVSISGASLKSKTRPVLGRKLTVGKLRAEVVRHHERGFGVAFTGIQKAEAIRKYFD
ncbi:MAG: PilZ domain-containing protein, partial [Pseudomonadota bacterium]